METRSWRARALTCALIAGAACLGLAARPAAAQTAQPAYRALDSNGVDLTHGDFVMSLVEGSIGSGEGALTLVRDGVWHSGYNGHVWDSIMLSEGPGNRSVSFGRRAEYFTGTNSLQGNGSTLTLSGDEYVHRSADGATTVFARRDPACAPTSSTSCQWLPVSIAAPDGRETVLSWEPWLICPDVPIDEGWQCTVDSIRLAGIANSHGYAIGFTYAADGAGGPSGPPLDWFRRLRADFYNEAAGPSPQAGVSYEYPSTGVTEVTETGGGKWRIAGSANIVTAIRRPGANADTTTIAYSSGRVASVTREGVTTNYSRLVDNAANFATMTVTQVDGDPNTADPVTIAVSDLAVGRPISVTDPLGKATAYQYDSSGRLTRVTAHEGNYVHYSYDARGNVTRTEAVPKGGAGARIVTAASFDSTCSNPATCNQPETTTDARGNVTSYAYDPEHGGVTAVTGPTVSGVAPQTRYAYTLVNGEYRLTGVSQCRTAGECAGTADEVRAAFGYDSNGNMVSVASGDGSGVLTATSAMTWDAVGNLLTVDGPLPGPADTSRIRYDGARRVVGTISPDPDGAGPLRHRAVRNVFDPLTHLPTRVEQGVVDGRSDGDWAAFAPAQAVETGYDGVRPVTARLVAGGTTYALTQTRYDGLGRPKCTAQRMDMADFAGPLPDACALTAPDGPEGPDRIVETVHDAAGRVTKVRTALHTADAADEVTATYTDNGLVETVKDGEGNLTTFEYDGHDRLARTRFPDPAKGSGTSSATDYEEPAYESLAGGARTSGLVTAFRNRAGETTGFGYDALGRLTAKDLPGAEPDSTYAYDLLGQMLSASRNGVTLSFTYDALGRQLTQTIPIAGIASPVFASEYDLAGRRTRLTWPVDASGPTAYYVDYDYLVTGEMSAVREKGATSGIGVLATYGYDDLGRRTSVTRGNGTTTGYQYDPVSRLSSMTHDMAGTAHDLTLSFTYNPASQIVGRTASNNLYAYPTTGNGTVASTADGLNRLATHGGAATGYDARGNLTWDGTTSYTYSSENLLTSFGPTGPLDYDPLLRFYKNYSTYFVHWGDEYLGEYYNGGIVFRYVPGPGTDETVAQVFKTGNRSWYHADERGSVIAGSGEGGASAWTGAYDEYGRRSGGAPRLAYTGQFHLYGEIYDYKNRNYSTRLGRFLQTDPIGYAGGMNLYAYVGNDPVNFTDPYGLDPKEGEEENDDSMDILVTGQRSRGGASAGALSALGRSRGSSSIVAQITGAGEAVQEQAEIVITAIREVRKATRPSLWTRIKQAGRWAVRQIYCGCLEAGTMVSTPDGLRRIEEIQVGDLVLSVNQATGEIAAKPVTDLIRPEAKPLYALRLLDASDETEAFHATDDHPWKVDGKGWVKTVDLKPGDRIDTGSGADMVVTSLTLTGRVEKTYNLTVADWHTFMVGEDGAVVHNACNPFKKTVERTGKTNAAWGEIIDWGGSADDAYNRASKLDPGQVDQMRGKGLTWEAAVFLRDAYLHREAHGKGIPVSPARAHLMNVILRNWWPE